MFVRLWWWSDGKDSDMKTQQRAHQETYRMEYNAITTLAEIRAESPCKDGWEKLLAHLGKTKADDEPLSLLTILDSNGLDDALWCLQVPSLERLSRHFQAWCAEQVVHHFSAERPDDTRVRDQIEMLKNDDASEEDRAAASAAARTSAWDAESAAARTSASAAARTSAWDAAWAAASAAARTSAWDAESAAAWAAASAAASAAARTSARTSAWDAESAAAWAAQEQQLRKMIGPA